MRAYRHVAIPLLIACGAFLVNRAVLDASLFGFDCYAAILTSRILSFSDFTGTFTEVLMDGRLWAADFYRPVGNLFLAADWAAWGMKSAGYQLTSLLVWCGAIVVLYLLLRRMLGGERWVGPTAAALFFALHPSALAVLPFPARRTETLMLLFVALALLLLPVNPRKDAWKSHLLAGVFAMLAVGSKETGVIAVALIFLHQALFDPRDDLGRRVVAACLAAVPAAVLAALVVITRFLVIGGMGGYHGGTREPYLSRLAEFGPQYFTATLASGVFDAPGRAGVATVLSVALVVIVAVGLVRLQRAGGDAEPRRTRIVLALGAAWLVMAIVLACLSMQFSARYVMPMTFATAIVLGALAEGVAGLLRNVDGEAPRSAPIGAAGALLAVGAVAVAGSPLYSSYPQFTEATRIQDQLLAEVKTRIDGAGPYDPIDLDLRRRMEIELRAVDDIWMIAPWGLQAWLELEYPDRPYTVERVVRPSTPMAEFWAVTMDPVHNAGR